MEKECEFFKLLFGGNSAFCADSSSSIFAGLWFRTPTPNSKQLNWIGRLITNYQHSEAVIHFAIVILGFVIVYYLGSITKKTKGVSCGVPGWIRWGFFISLFIEVYTMCVPYMFLFAWAWLPFIQLEKGPLVTFVENLDDNDSFLKGIQLGAALITMFWVSVVVLILDTWATVKAWNFAVNGKDAFFASSVINGVCLAFTAYLWIDFFDEEGRGNAKDGSFHFSEFIGDTLHSLFGNDHTSMSSLLK